MPPDLRNPLKNILHDILERFCACFATCLAFIFAFIFARTIVAMLSRRVPTRRSCRVVPSDSTDP